MSRTYTQLFSMIGRQFGHPWPVTGTADTGGSTTVLRDAQLKLYPDDWFNGAWIYLTSGSPTFTELLCTDFDGTTNGDLTLKPTLGAAPDTLTYSILPFSQTEILRSLTDALLELYDRGLLVRQFSIRMMGGSPLYNADWSYWTSSTTPDGWARAGTGTIARERNSAHIGSTETSLQLSTTADYVALSHPWKRFLWDMKGTTVTFYCPVKTSTASIARLNLYNGSNNYSATHGGTGDWEMLSVEVTVADTATDLEPRLYNDGTAAVYFGMPFVLGGRSISEYPFPSALMPGGPDEVRRMEAGIRKDHIASGRGLMNLREFGRQRALSDFGFARHHDEATTTDLGILDFSIGRPGPANGQLLLAKGTGPLTVPSAMTDNLEISESESLLLATLAALKVLERNVSGGKDAQERTAHLRAQFERLAGGVGQTRGVAALPMRW